MNASSECISSVNLVEMLSWTELLRTVCYLLGHFAGGLRSVLHELQGSSMIEVIIDGACSFN